MERGVRGQLMNLVHAAFAGRWITVTWTTSLFPQSAGGWRTGCSPGDPARSETPCITGGGASPTAHCIYVI